jgi:hypothetical protein
MPRDENILGTYRNGGAQERMDTYLEYPGLRGRFDEIEREEDRRAPSGNAATGAPEMGESPPPPWQILPRGEKGGERVPV